MEMKYESIWKIQHIRNGVVIWEDEGPNAVSQEGEEALLESYFRGNATYDPSEFYIRLCNSTPTVVSLLSTIVGEPPATYGYAPQLIERSTIGFPTKEIDTGAYRIVSKTVSFSAVGGSIGPITNAYLATTSDNTGKFLAFRALSITRTILDTDTMTIQFRIRIS